MRIASRALPLLKYSNKLNEVMKLGHLLIASMLLVAGACAEEKEVSVTISSEVINAGYIGNGVEWDPYDEAKSWGQEVSDEDWGKLYERLDYMRPPYVRCMINSPYRYYDAATGKYDKHRNFDSLSRLLKYCTEKGITVVYGEYNPPTWEMKADSRWIEMSVDYLNFLVNDCGYSCIKHFVIFNEPDGDWASTNGDYELWKSVLLRFRREMDKYPGLTDQVTFAGPDVVVGYKNPASPYDAVGWVKQTAAELDSLIGVYDIHAYPGQHEVRSGHYSEILPLYKQSVPQHKKIILGEAGYKYKQLADSALMAEYNRRVEGHPFTKGTDCNMLVYDYFYGLDMPLLAMEVMNNGLSGVAAWMLDDAMHSKWDSGNTEDIKIWGMWNILGEEVFGKPDEEEMRPWFYTWSLMCRFFPAGTDVLKTEIVSADKSVYAVAGSWEGKTTVALVNVGDEDYNLRIRLPKKMQDASLYVYEEENMQKNKQGFPVAAEEGLNVEETYATTLKASSFRLLTEIKD